MPDLDIRRIWFPVTLTDPVRVEGQATAWLVQERANQVLLDPYNGEVLAMERAEQASAYKRWGDMADPLHFGDFGGIPTKILWSLFGMALPAMVLTGSYLSLRQSQKPTPKAYRLGACVSALLFAISLYYSVPAATRYKTPAVPVWQTQEEIASGHGGLGWLRQVKPCGSKRCARDVSRTSNRSQLPPEKANQSL